MELTIRNKGRSEISLFRNHNPHFKKVMLYFTLFYLVDVTTTKINFIIFYIYFLKWGV
jgi:hypothetical protein